MVLGEVKMGLSVKSEPKDGYLLIIVSGEYGSPPIPEVIDRVLDHCKEHKPSKVLVDIRPMTGNIPAMDRFYFGEVFSGRFYEEKKRGNISHIRFAFIGHYPIVDPNKFGETVAVNRGMTLKVTTDLKEALDWILVE